MASEAGKVISENANPHKAKYLTLYNELIKTHQVARSKVADHLGIKSNTLSNRIRRDNYYPSLYDVMILERITELYRRVSRDIETIKSDTRQTITSIEKDNT